MSQSPSRLHSRILGVGSYVPPRVLKNDDLKSMLDTSDEWIQQRTGIKERHWVEGTTCSSDLGLEAAKNALEAAGVQKEELDMIIFATLSPDHEFPGTACFLQAKLGVPGIPALDVRQQCTGFIYGMAIADQFIRSGTYRKILLIGAEVHSKGLDKTTRGRDVSVLFGDGAGAVVIGAAEGTEGGRIYSTHLHADGNFARELWIKVPALTYDHERITPELLAQGEQYPKMNGKTVFLHAVKRMPEALMEALNANGMKVSDVDLFVLHQANLRICEAVAKTLGIPEHKMFNTIDRFANTTAATIPLGLSEAVKAGALKPGMLVACAAFGSGFTWGSALLRW
jgi:3-oxoacyl-[acyl-carrier-protein] synthase III